MEETIQQSTQGNIPRHSDIPCVVGVEQYESGSDLAFRSWLLTRGTTLDTIKGTSEYDEWIADYEDYRRGQVVIGNDFTLLDSLKYEWQHSPKTFIVTGLIVALVIGLGVAAVHWLK